MKYDTFKFEIVAHLGTISERIDFNGNKWFKEVNQVSWNDNTPKLDIREWNENHTKMSKGLALTNREAEELAMILHEYCRERGE